MQRLEQGKSASAIVAQHRQPLQANLGRVLETEEERALDEVLDLAPVQLALDQPIEISARHFELATAAGLLDEVLPDSTARCRREVGLGDEQIHSGLKGVF